REIHRRDRTLGYARGDGAARTDLRRGDGCVRLRRRRAQGTTGRRGADRGGVVRPAERPVAHAADPAVRPGRGPADRRRPRHRRRVADPDRRRADRRLDRRPPRRRPPPARRLTHNPDFHPSTPKDYEEMAELTIRPEEIRDALDRFVSSYQPEAAAREEIGTVVDAGDGIAHVEGLPSVMANELLEFEDGTLGVAQNLDVREIGVVILGEFSGIDEGQRVRRTGEILSVPVGDGYLG